MSGNSGSNNAEDALEAVQQKITFTLQQIDSDFVRANQFATQLLSQAKAFTAINKQIASSLQVQRSVSLAPSLSCDAHTASC